MTRKGERLFVNYPTSELAEIVHWLRGMEIVARDQRGEAVRSGQKTEGLPTERQARDLHGEAVWELSRRQGGLARTL